MESTKAVKEKDKKEPMTPKQRTIFILKIVGNVVFYAVLILLFLISIANINSGGKGGIPSIFGKGFLSVETTSMDGNPGVITSSVKEEYTDYQKEYLTKNGLLNEDGQYVLDYSKFEIGGFDNHAMVVVDMLNEESRKHLKVGDVITYYDGTIQALNTHRIVYVDVDQNGNNLSYITMGDRAVYQQKDVWSGNSWKIEHYEDVIGQQTKTLNVDSTDIKAKVTSVNPGAGDFIKNIRANWLFYFVIPVAILLVIEVVLVVKNIFDLRREKNKAIDLADHEAQMAELQSEKERMRQELLAELRAQGALPAEEPKQEAPTEEKVEEPEVAPIVEEKAPVEETKVEETPAEDEKTEEVEEVKQEETTEESSVEEKEEEKEPVVNDEALEPDMDIEENEEEK